MPCFRLIKGGILRDFDHFRTILILDSSNFRISVLTFSGFLTLSNADIISGSPLTVGHFWSAWFANISQESHTYVSLLSKDPASCPKVVRGHLIGVTKVPKREWPPTATRSSPPKCRYCEKICQDTAIMLQHSLAFLCFSSSTEKKYTFNGK